LNLLLALYALSFCIGFGLFVAVRLIKSCHLIDALSILGLYLILELELVEHLGDFLGRKGRVGLYQV